MPNTGGKSNYDRRWRKLAAQVRAEQHGICAQCGHTPRTLDVHHIKPKTTHPHLAYTRNNLIALCRPCHNTIDAQRRQQEGGDQPQPHPTDTRASPSVSPRARKNSGLGFRSRVW